MLVIFEIFLSSFRLVIIIIIIIIIISKSYIALISTKKVLKALSIYTFIQKERFLKVMNF